MRTRALAVTLLLASAMTGTAAARPAGVWDCAPNPGQSHICNLGACGGPTAARSVSIDYAGKTLTFPGERPIKWKLLQGGATNVYYAFADLPYYLTVDDTLARAVLISGQTPASTGALLWAYTGLACRKR